MWFVSIRIIINVLYRQDSVSDLNLMTFAAIIGCSTDYDSLFIYFKTLLVLLYPIDLFIWAQLNHQIQPMRIINHLHPPLILPPSHHHHRRRLLPSLRIIIIIIILTVTTIHNILNQH